jgi:hypothetical protein
LDTHLNRIIIAWIAVILLFTFAEIGSAFADTPLPRCEPNQTTAPVGTDWQVKCNTLGCAQVWFCNVDHQWYRSGYAGHWSEITSQTMLKIRQLFSTGTRAQKQAAWEAAFPPGSKVLEDPTSPDFDLLPLYRSVPAPSIDPPDGRVTQSNIVYKQRQDVGSYTWVPIGAVPLGVPCTNVKVGPYYAIDRTRITMASAYDVKPLSVYAKCD